MAVSTIISKFIKAATNKGKKPNFGALKTKLEKKIREGTATKEDKKALKQLRQKDTSATRKQKVSQSQSSRKTPVSLAGSKKVGGTQPSKLKQGLASVKDLPPESPIKKVTPKPMSAAKKKRVEAARKKGPGALMREGLSDILNKKKVGGKVKSKGRKGGGKMKSKGYAGGGKMKSKGMSIGGKMKSKGMSVGGRKPRGVGAAIRGFGKAMK